MLLSDELYLTGLKIQWKNIECDSYLKNIEAIRSIDELYFHSPVTFFVGENGSGKSTLLEAIAVAYGFNVATPIRLEAELNVHSSKEDKSENDLLKYGYYYYDNMSVSTVTSMFNVYYDFVNSSRFTPFVMAGFGASVISYDYEKTELTPSGRYYHIEDNDSKSDFAYQVGLGLSFKINRHFIADVMYKYADLGDFKFNWNTNKLEQTEDLISAGVRYTF